MSDIIHQQMLDLIKNEKPENANKTIDYRKLDFNLYGDHKTIRPYDTVEQGIIWYLSQDTIKYLPEQMIIPMVALNFNITEDEAKKQFNLQAYKHTGIVRLD